MLSALLFTYFIMGYELGDSRANLPRGDIDRLIEWMYMKYLYWKVGMIVMNDILTAYRKTNNRDTYKPWKG